MICAVWLTVALHTDVVPASKLPASPPAPEAATRSTGAWRQDALPSAGTSRLSFSSSADSKPAEQLIKQSPLVPSAVSVQGLSAATQPLQAADAAVPAVPALALSNVKAEPESAARSSRSTDSTQVELNSPLESSAGMQIPLALTLVATKGISLCSSCVGRV